MKIVGWQKDANWPTISIFLMDKSMHFGSQYAVFQNALKETYIVQLAALSFFRSYSGKFLTSIKNIIGCQSASYYELDIHTWGV